MGHKAPPAVAPAVESLPTQTTGQAQSEKNIVPNRELPRIVSERANDFEPVATPASSNVPSDASTNPTASSQAVDTLVSLQTGFDQKQAVLKQLKEAGKLDQVIADLKQRAADNPNSPEIQTALGEAYLYKFPVQDYNEAAILGMQVDQSFNAALKLDPANWEAQFFKAESLSYWPPELNKGPEVIQRLSSLIDQQETMPPQPQFARTYVLLGEQYQKAGRLDYAKQVWQLGAARFSGDPTLQGKITNPPRQ
jgi:cytochrome c-type biogenesis protein CcmH/NrfG